ncbi:MAG: electron transfer flavoprotein beta subunit/FixA family protein [Syntrophomonadaceae bacterium]|jgi:electron transfer flavoprotein beta subunit|nr:electron transfer flavoprotein beta subunit/FixA family protein [Syntrophomonadaceae bacterium]
MSRIIACYKWVADEADLKINPDMSVDLSKAKGKISDYDKNAIEAAVQMAKITGDEAVTLTYGSKKAKLSLKDALSRGPSEGFWVNSEKAEQADGAASSKALAAAIDKIGDYKLIICAEGASDTFARQVGPSVAARLGIPCVSSAIKLELCENELKISRKLEDGIEIVAAQLPAVVCILPEINRPPIPGLKSVLDAGKKTTREYKIEELGLLESDLSARTETIDFKAYVMNRKNIVLDGETAADKVKALVGSLKKEGII